MKMPGKPEGKEGQSGWIRRATAAVYPYGPRSRPPSSVDAVLSQRPAVSALLRGTTVSTLPGGVDAHRRGDGAPPAPGAARRGGDRGGAYRIGPPDVGGCAMAGRFDNSKERQTPQTVKADTQPHVKPATSRRPFSGCDLRVRWRSAARDARLLGSHPGAAVEQFAGGVEVAGVDRGLGDDVQDDLP